jgi:hypothetical protein
MEKKKKKKKITNGPRSLQRTTTRWGPTLIPIVPAEQWKLQNNSSFQK